MTTINRIKQPTDAMEELWTGVRKHTADLRRILLAEPETWSKSDACFVKMTLAAVLATINEHDALIRDSRKDGAQ